MLDLSDVVSLALSCDSLTIVISLKISTYVSNGGVSISIVLSCLSNRLVACNKSSATENAYMLIDSKKVFVRAHRQGFDLVSDVTLDRNSGRDEWGLEMDKMSPVTCDKNHIPVCMMITSD
jgi:hypothetical protein